jgi:hypothetical protein
MLIQSGHGTRHNSVEGEGGEEHFTVVDLKCPGTAVTFWSALRLDEEVDVNIFMDAFAAGFMGGTPLGHTQRAALAEELGCSAWFGRVTSAAFSKFCARVAKNWADPSDPASLGDAGIVAWVERHSEARDDVLTSAGDDVRAQRGRRVGWTLIALGLICLLVATDGMSSKADDGKTPAVFLGIAFIACGLGLLVWYCCNEPHACIGVCW